MLNFGRFQFKSNGKCGDNDSPEVYELMKKERQTERKKERGKA